MLLSAEKRLIQCKYCGANHVVKCGSYKGVPRYFCKLCQRKFKDDNHVFHMGVHPEMINFVLSSYYGGMKIGDIKNHLRLKYGYYPSSTVVHQWIGKFTKIASQEIKKFSPKVGKSWVATEMEVRIGRQELYFYELMDSSTLFLLTSKVSFRSNSIIEDLFNKSQDLTRDCPQTIFVYMPYFRFKLLEKSTAYKLEHVPRDKYADLHRIGISGETNMFRNMNLLYLRTTKTANIFLDGLAIYYNYFRPNTHLDGKTPAEKAAINYNAKSWQQLALSTPPKSIL